jgi:hypothetical protein
MMTGPAKVFHSADNAKNLRPVWKETVITITPKPEQEQILTQAIQAGLIADVIGSPPGVGNGRGVDREIQRVG